MGIIRSFLAFEHLVKLKRCGKLLPIATIPIVLQLICNSRMIWLLSLPLEILLDINSYLDLAAQLALKITNRKLFYLLPMIKPTDQILTTLTPCAKRALRHHLIFDPDRRRCAWCKQLHPNSLFTPLPTDAASESRERERVLRRGFGDFGGPGMIDLPDGICGWHKSELCVVKSRLEHKGSPLAPGWYSKLGSICLCCGKRAFLECCDCKCGTCGRRMVRYFVRVCDSMEKQPRRFVVLREDGNYSVREWKTGGQYTDLVVQMLE